MLARDANITVIDFETTGTVRGFPAEPWQIGLVALEQGRVVPQSCFSSLLRVDATRPFNRYAPGRYAQLRHQIAAAPGLAELWPELRLRLEARVLAAHSVATEKKCLGEAFPLHPLGPWIDTLTLVRIAYPGSDCHTLERVLDGFSLSVAVAQICPGLAPHDALYDAVACAAVLQFLLDLPTWRDVSLNSLVNAKAVSFLRQRTARTRRGRR